MVSESASPLVPGGRNAHVGELSTALAALGHEVRVYTRRDAPDRPDRVRVADRMTVEHAPPGPADGPPEDPRMPHVGEFGRWLADHWAAGAAPDVVHAHHWTSGLAALTATAETRLPVVVTFHGTGAARRRHGGDGDTGPPTRLGLERTLGQIADAVVASCAEDAGDLARMGVPRGRIAIVPSGVDSERFTPVGPGRPRVEGRHRILGVGRLVRRKGFEDLIRAIRRVPHAEAVIAGGPPADRMAADPEVRRLSVVAEQAEVGDRVVFLGAVPRADMPEWYRSADVLCCSPRYEPLGLTALEAMACGVPVVTYAVGGPAESVIDGVTGVHVSPGDVRGLASALRGLLTDDVRRMSFASAAVDRVRSRYTWHRTALDVERVYAGVLVRDAVAAG
jgi:glycosyltransferase involved in cell wall biosynthesis